MRHYPCKGLPCALVVLALALTTVPAHSADADGPTLTGLLDGTGFTYTVKDATTAVVIIRGDTAVHAVTVRLVQEILAVFADVVEVEEDRVPPVLWKKAAEANARPSLAHVGYLKRGGKFIAVSGVEAEVGTSPLLRMMIVHVTLLADELQPSFRDLLLVE